MYCTIWDHLYNLKSVKNTHGEVLLLVKLQANSRNPNAAKYEPEKGLYLDSFSASVRKSLI